MKTLFLSIFAILTCCAKPPITPETPKDYIKVSPVFENDTPNKEVAVIVEAWKTLSRRNHLEFSETVTIGFSKIQKSNVIGTCSYGYGWREIDIDTEYWNNASWLSKVNLVYHELTHCYCFRDHDYSDGKKYKDSFWGRIFNTDDADGFLPDGCAKSIMHPSIQDDACFEKHYKHYVKEMFNRCDPY